MSAQRTVDQELAELEGFALKTHAYCRLTGASLAMHAIPDAFLVLHVGVGCKYKGAGQFTLHDLARVAHHRENYTEVNDRALIQGSGDRVGIYVRNFYRKRRPRFMAVATMTFLEMTGEDFGRAVRDAAKTVPCPVAYVPTPGFEGDLYAGYAAVIREVLKLVPFKKTKPVRGRIGIIGYPFDRYEMDHAGNLQQLRHLLESIGLEPGPVFLSGRPMAELLRAGSCEKFVVFPYMRPGLDELKDLVGGRPLIATDIPVGVSGTFRWLHDVGRACGVGRGVLEKALRTQKDYARPQLDMFRNYIGHRIGSARAAIFAATPLAAGLTALTSELGMNPLLVGLRDRDLGGRAAFAEAVGRTGVRPPVDLDVVETPSLDLTCRKVQALRDAGRLSVLFSSSAEKNCVAAGGGSLPPHIEIGFPSQSYHVLYPEPFYGIGGSLVLAQRIMNSVR
ncbi:MAG: nitrogenase component 1 [Elusimicrobiota bacterium]